MVSSLTEDHERRACEIEAKYQAKLRALQAQNDLRRKTELHELEGRKNTQVTVGPQLAYIVFQFRIALLL